MQLIILITKKNEICVPIRVIHLPSINVIYVEYIFNTFLNIYFSRDGAKSVTTVDSISTILFF